MAGLSWKGKRTLDFPRFAGYNDRDQKVRINSDVHQSEAPGSCNFRALHFRLPLSFLPIQPFANEMTNHVCREGSS